MPTTPRSACRIVILEDHVLFAESLELALTKSGANGDVNFTIFDIPQTIENAKKV